MADDAYVKSDICKKEHERVDERLNHHERWLGEHEEKIDALTRSDAANTNEIKNLCNRIGSQTTAIWGLVASIFMVLVGFFIWYVQNK
jgi:hypothetical protein